MRNIFIFVLFFVNLTLFAQQKVHFTPEDLVVFDRYAAYIKPHRGEPVENILEKTALFFLDTPYVAHTLEVTSSEQLVVNLRELDCTTFVENVLALTRVAKSDNFTFCAYTDALRTLRYRTEAIENYASRLHYTSDWVFENERRRLVKNISRRLGGVRETKTINFMSRHSDAYKHLKGNAAMCQEIAAMEEKLNARGGFIYLPKKQIAAKADQIPHMAMIAFVTSIEGLDATHVAFAYRKKDNLLSFVHASSACGKVIVDAKLLHDYCATQKSCKGIMVIKVEK